MGIGPYKQSKFTMSDALIFALWFIQNERYIIYGDMNNHTIEYKINEAIKIFKHERARQNN